MKKLILGLIAGGLYGMLFSNESGKDLRTKLQKSKSPIKDLIVAGSKMDLDFVRTLLDMVDGGDTRKK